MKFQKIGGGSKKDDTVLPSDVAKYLLYRSFQDGELVTPLKMQKLVYYAYVWTLVRNGKKLFDESIEAWPQGPVVPSLYRTLKRFGSSPIGEAFIGTEADFEKTVSKFSPDVKATLDNVYEEYMTKTAFELVALTHSEKPWLEARDGLVPTQASNVVISDDTIIQSYG